MSFRTWYAGKSGLPLQHRRWQVPIVAPAILAALLVAALAFQSARAVQLHRRIAVNALRDYAAFATWQYTRRASDYVRLILTASLPSRALRRAGQPSPTCGVLPHFGSGASRCPNALPDEGAIACRVRDNEQIEVARNETAYSDSVVDMALADAARQRASSGYGIGLVRIGPAHAQRLLAFWLDTDTPTPLGHCNGMVLAPAVLIPVLEHVAAFAPLLPSALVGKLPNDSLVSIEVTMADSTPIARIGASSTGISATDVIGPDLADLRVIATLHPAAMQRLMAGGMPTTNLPALVAMLVVTLLLCAVAVVQLRRSQEIIRLRSDFVASVSHELKTPLAQISLFADTLAAPRERTADERRQYLGIISREAKRLGQLVDSILHFAGMARSHTAPSTREPAMLGEEIRAALTAFEPIAAARSVTLVAALDGEIEVTLDRDAFRQLMFNALDNALKFGPEGQRITIAMTMAGDRALLTIDDEGPGLPSAEREAVFEPFVRIDRIASKGGSGIGLAVVRDVVARHGGAVRITDAPGGGARLEVEIPHACAALAVTPA